MDVCIKNIEETDWKNFRMEAIKHDLKTGEMFSKLVREHMNKSNIAISYFWVPFYKKSRILW